MASDKGHCILFAFQLKKKAIEVVEMICCALGEGTMIHTISYKKIGARNLAKEEASTLKTKNMPADLENLRTRNCESKLS